MRRIDTMGIFNFLKFEKRSRSNRDTSEWDEEQINRVLNEIFPESSYEDYLGQAAQVGHAAREAIKAEEHDRAWGLLHEQKSLYLQHANRCGWNKKDTLSLDGSISQSFANILRLEGKHHQAFVHILYWIITSRNKTKTQKQKLNSYFNRCKFNNISMKDVEDFIELQESSPDYVIIQNKVDEWRSL